jgi:transketolase C-terminal domain/subunit
MSKPGEYFRLPMWGMKYKNMQAQQLRHLNSVITREDHLPDGGFGSWMLEALHKYDVVLRMEALDPKICGMVGSTDYLLNQGKL